MTSIIVLTPMGIHQVIEPFRLVVRSEEMVEGWKVGQIVLAAEVRFHELHMIIFRIDDTWYSYRHFAILL